MIVYSVGLCVSFILTGLIGNFLVYRFDVLSLSCG